MDERRVLKEMYNWKRTDTKGSRCIDEFRAKNGVCVLKFPALEETGCVIHAFSTRIGGVSSGVCSTMNLSFTREDDSRENVLENYRRMAQALGVAFDSFVLTHQTHSTNIRRVTKADCQKGILRERDYSDIDGFVTDEPGITLVTFFADCIPLYFVDPVKKAIGLAHSGWKGTLYGMADKMVKRMEAEFHSHPKDIIAAIGPGICRSCYEVGMDVADAFRDRYDANEFDAIISDIRGNHCRLDLWKANEICLLKAGILPEHINVSDICTHCNPDLLFSHRKMGERRGNLAAFLALKQ